MSIHCAKIAIYLSSEKIRYIDLYWNERIDSAVIREDDRLHTILIKPDATLLDALVGLGYKESMKLDFYEPYLTSIRDKKEHLERLLLTLENNRIIITAPRCSFAGKPAMVGW